MLQSHLRSIVQMNVASSKLRLIGATLTGIFTRRLARQLIWAALVAMWASLQFVYLDSVAGSSASALKSSSIESSSIESSNDRATASAYGAAVCDTSTQIPIQECDALVQLYEQTNGVEWQDNSGWLTINDRVQPCDWFGVTCSNDRVTQIDLASNGLSGDFPARIVSLSSLTHLLLNDNQLTGTLPLAICEFTSKFEVLNLSYNQLYATNLRTRLCLNEVNPGWSTTQTIPPLAIQATAFSTDSVQLSWNPISYSGSDGGNYEISYATGRDEAFTIHGMTSDLNADGYLVNGLNAGTPYIFRVQTYTPASQQQTDEQRSAYAYSAAVTESTEDDVLLLVYFPADNDLSPYVNSVVRRLRTGTRLNPNIRVIMLTDRAGENNTNLLEIYRGDMNESSAILNAWATSELDTTDPHVLAWFLTNSRSLYPASRTIVSLMGHGVGLSPEFEWTADGENEIEPGTNNGIPALPKGLDFTPGDITNNGGYLSTHDLAYALNEATDNGANPFDVVFFDQCFQGNLDVLYEVRNTAEVFIGSPNYAWLAAPYHRYLPALVPSNTPEEMARSIIRIYQNSLNRFHPNAIFMSTRGEIEDVADAVSNLGEALLDATNAGQDELILQASMNGKYVDTTQCGRQNLILGPPDELLGAGTFANNLLRLFPAQSAVANAASNVVDALEEIEFNAQSGRPHIAIERDAGSEQIFWDYEETFTILAPLRRNAPAEIAWRASIYTEETPIAAKWSSVPTQTVNITNTFAFVQDKQWDEFIDVWYTTELEPTVGDWCSYIPPVIVSETETETLSLELTAVGGQVELNWAATGQDRAVEYLTLARQEDGAWRTLTVTDLNQTDFAFAPPQADQTVAFMVVAQDESGLAVAQSEEVSIRLDSPTPDVPDPNEPNPNEPDDSFIYIPLISGQ